jgi:phytoene dehydrogenase-like protein
MVAIPRALARILKANGGELRLKARVKRIVIRDGVARGVSMEDGEEIEADTVLSNASCIPTYMDLVGEEHLSKAFVRALKGYRVSIPSPIVYFGLSEKPPFRCHSAVLVGGLEKVNAYWDEYYAHGLMARIDDLPVGLTCPSLYDDTLAPEGRYAVSAILPSPYRLKYSNWDAEKPYFIEEVIASVERRAFPGFGSLVEFADMTTPLDFERELNLPEGAIYGLEMSVPTLGPFRASYRSPVVKGLYLTGASTNPGGGVPLVMMSGMFVSSLMVKDRAGA